jgi:hypothetical protein
MVWAVESAEAKRHTSTVVQVHDAIAAVTKLSVLTRTNFWKQLLTEIDDNLSEDEIAGETTLVALAILDGHVTAPVWGTPVRGLSHSANYVS